MNSDDEKGQMTIANQIRKRTRRSHLSIGVRITIKLATTTSILRRYRISLGANTITKPSPRQLL